MLSRGVGLIKKSSLRGVAPRLGGFRCLSATPFEYQPLFDLKCNKDETEYRLLTTDHVEKVTVGNETFLKVAPEGLRMLSGQAMKDIARRVTRCIFLMHTQQGCRVERKDVLCALI